MRVKHWNVDGHIHFPIDPFLIAERLGIEVEEDVLDANTAGFIIRKAGGPTRIYLNINDAPSRQRFTLAHELGHFIQHQDEAEIGFVDRRDELASYGVDGHEIWANQFAAELLMPAATVTKWWAEGRDPDRMRRDLGVSAAALTYRLKNLRLLNG